MMMLTVDPQRLYGYLEVVRGRVLERVGGLSDEQYRREFPIGPGSVAKTLAHMMVSEWYYVQRMHGREVPPYDAWPVRESTPPPVDELVRLWGEQAAASRRDLAAVTDWEAPLSYRVTTDEGKRIVVTATPADQFVQLFQHEVYHRPQVVNMLRQLGCAGLGDLDFNAVMFERREE